MKGEKEPNLSITLLFCVKYDTQHFVKVFFLMSCDLKKLHIVKKICNKLPFIRNLRTE